MQPTTDGLSNPWWTVTQVADKFCRLAWETSFISGQLPEFHSSSFTNEHRFAFTFLKNRQPNNDPVHFWITKESCQTWRKTTCPGKQLVSCLCINLILNCSMHQPHPEFPLVWIQTNTREVVIGINSTFLLQTGYLLLMAFLRVPYTPGALFQGDQWTGAGGKGKKLGSADKVPCMHGYFSPDPPLNEYDLGVPSQCARVSILHWSIFYPKDKHADRKESSCGRAPASKLNGLQLCASQSWSTKVIMTVTFILWHCNTEQHLALGHPTGVTSSALTSDWVPDSFQSVHISF